MPSLLTRLFKYARVLLFNGREPTCQWRIERDILIIKEGETQFQFVGTDLRSASVVTLYHQYFDAMVTLDFGPELTFNMIQGEDPGRDIAQWLERYAGYDSEPIRIAALAWVKDPVALEKINIGAKG